ncbi:MAG TPA: methyltransferase domain-containing protein, partial [Roseiflexaceae bacterium]|nr:methyltransferase domain-containing protein [Roseiflexaceae bacterium]
MELKETIQQQFGSVAEQYATSAVHSAGPDLAALVAAVPAGITRALDLGCGPGHTTLALAAHAAEVIGLDLTAGMLDRARALAAERAIG